LCAACVDPGWAAYNQPITPYVNGLWFLEYVNRLGFIEYVNGLEFGILVNIYDCYILYSSVLSYACVLRPSWLQGIRSSLAPRHKTAVGGSLEWLLIIIIVDPSVGHSSCTAAVGLD
jgi:hypothetical protein